MADENRMSMPDRDEMRQRRERLQMSQKKMKEERNDSPDSDRSEIRPNATSPQYEQMEEQAMDDRDPMGTARGTKDPRQQNSSDEPMSRNAQKSPKSMEERARKGVRREDVDRAGGPGAA